MSNLFSLKQTPSLVDIYFKDGKSSHYADVHQILMTSQQHISITHGPEIITIPYDVIDRIQIHFESSSAAD